MNNRSEFRDNDNEPLIGMPRVYERAQSLRPFHVAVNGPICLAFQIVRMFVFNIFAWPELARPSPARQLSCRMRPPTIGVTIHRYFFKTLLDRAVVTFCKTYRTTSGNSFQSSLI